MQKKNEIIPEGISATEKVRKNLREKYKLWMSEFLCGELPEGLLQDNSFMKALFTEAVEIGNKEVVKRIIENKYFDFTTNLQVPLLMAIQEGHTELAKLLIPYADKSAMQLAYYLAVDMGNFELVQICLNNLEVMPEEHAAAIRAFEKGYFDITLLLTSFPSVKQFLSSCVKSDMYIDGRTIEQVKEIAEQINAFKKTAQKHLNASPYQANNTYLFFNDIASEILPNDVKGYIKGLVLADIKQHWTIPPVQLKNIYSIKESILSDIDEPVLEENTISPK